MGVICRLWWPRHLGCSEYPIHGFLYGWCVSSYPSIDFIIAGAFDEVSISNYHSSLQDILQATNASMPSSLQDKSRFSLLGQCSSLYSNSGAAIPNHRTNNKGKNQRTNGIDPAPNWHCEFCQRNRLAEQCLEASRASCHWVQLAYYSGKHDGPDIHWVPKLHHIRWKGRAVSERVAHVIAYESPVYGVHHFSLNLWSPCDPAESPLVKPKWVQDPHLNSSPCSLDTVILTVNCSSAARLIVEAYANPSRSFPTSLLSLIYGLLWLVLAIFVSTISTFFYVVVQKFHLLLIRRTEPWICRVLQRMFGTIFMSIHMRSLQFLYWPIFLQDNVVRSKSCTEYAEKAALRRHSMWSSLAFDLLLGSIAGFFLLFHAEHACLSVSKLAMEFTNELFRPGCVWLMGVPAGFKLNTELANALGMASLNAMHIWSRFWIFFSFLLIYFIKVLAFLGILFGATVPAALLQDVISLTMLHVSIFHWAISLLYAYQIQTLSALWRLFKGQKWNPLRHRIDSYDYSINQHVIASLTFMPLLLLLPTISIFYIFFTILNTAFMLVCMLIQVSISMVHATPYFQVFLWLMRSKRLPSGIWFDIVHCHCNSSPFLDDYGPSENLKLRNRYEESDGTIVSVLHSNSLSLAEIVMPHYKKIFAEVAGFLSVMAHGALVGKRAAFSLRFGNLSRMAWMSIPAGVYWRLCYDSVLACARKID